MNCELSNKERDYFGTALLKKNTIKNYKLKELLILKNVPYRQKK